MPKRSHNWLRFASETLANKTNSQRCVMQVLSFQGIGYPPRLRTIVDCESVTYVSERLLPMCPVCTNVIAWAIGPGTSQSSSRALKARNDREDILILTVSFLSRHFALSALGDSDACSPRALPWAITFRACGAVNITPRRKPNP